MTIEKYDIMNTLKIVMLEMLFASPLKDNIIMF